ncbi:hypothetical protein GLYMA_13G178650v4 [Glycine max]|nr:hypothetical protein GLYMA_13G178650v4 [Glycine max]KAH1102089.1 hypothetical protein GYH30_036578 [Glycine max]
MLISRCRLLLCLCKVILMISDGRRRNAYAKAS